MAISANRNAALYREQRDRAEANLALAKDAIGKYVTQLTSDEGLLETDSHALRRQILETTLPMYEKLAEQMPGDAQIQLNRADAFLRLAMIHFWSGRPNESERDYQQALAIQMKLAADFPGMPECRIRLAQTLNSFGIHLYLAGDYVRAREHFQQALGTSTALVGDFSNVPEYRSEQAWSHNNLGLVLRRLGDSADAYKHYVDAVAIQSGLAEDFPSNTAYRVDQARALALTGHVTEAAQMAERLLVEKKAALNNLGFGNLACLFAICGSTAEIPINNGADPEQILELTMERHTADTNKPTTIDKSQRDAWVVRAMELLRLERDRGTYKRPANVIWLQKDPDFAGIRNRPEFVAFVNELRASQGASKQNLKIESKSIAPH